MKTLVLFSSANPQGNTAQVVERVAQHVDTEIINIDELSISAYNYENQYPNDDFYPLVEKILQADNVIFASPIYWHAPTAPMKAFIDRITELTDVAALKTKARSLASKRAFVLTSSANTEICSVFEQMFSKIFSYFSMQYAGKLHADCRENIAINPRELDTFISALLTKPLERSITHLSTDSNASS